MYTDPDRAVYKALNMKENTENGPLSGEYIIINVHRPWSSRV